MSYDLIVIGSGPGGYVCAIRASQLGLKVAVVEKRAAHGGTCLNVGCIPSKALLQASHCYDEAQHQFAGMGIKVTPKLDLTQMMAFKDAGVKGNVDGVAYLLKKHKIDAFHGSARIAGAGQIEVTLASGDNTVLEARAIVIATGSDIAPLPGLDIDETLIVSSTGALKLTKVPKRMIIIGAGVIGLELGSVWKRLGAEVTVLEYLPRILPGMDGDLAKSVQRILEKQGLTFRLGSKVLGAEVAGKTVSVTVEGADGSGRQVLETDVVLVAVGRVPYTAGLGLDAVGVATDSRGRIPVNDRYETAVAGLYAIGDVIAGPMLAHKAEDEGVAVAEILAGQAGHVNYKVIPNVIYTSPEVASVGKTEEELQAAGHAYTAGKFPFMANGRAKVNKTTDGFVKVLADAASDRILGVHIVGPHAGELIAEAAVIMEFGGSAEDLARTCHAHPTLSEAMKEAAMAVAKRAIHI
jgi:dihydrolipoamide dehydrogenase